MTALFALDQVSTLLSTPSEALPRQAATGGWLTSCRMSKRVGFLVLHDGSSVAPLQVVVPDALLQEQPALRGLTAGCSVRVRGTLPSGLESVLHEGNRGWAHGGGHGFVGATGW